MTDTAAPWMVSADSHVIEPPDLWRERLPARWRDAAPEVRRGDDGCDWWWVDGHRTNSFAGGTQAGARFDDPDSLVLADRWENVRPGGWQADAHLADNESDGVLASVLYPTQHMVHYKVRDRDLLDDLCRAYNDWLAELCAAAPTRLVGIASLNVDDVTRAVGELHRAAALGLRGVMIPVGLPRRGSYADPIYEPLWAAAADAGLPISLHIGTDRADPDRAAAPVIPGAQLAVPRPVQSAFATADHGVRLALADLIFSGVLERHPSLQVGSVEHEGGWAAHFLERMDFTYTQRATRGYRFADAALPSDFFRRQVFVTFSEDDLAIAGRSHTGVEPLLWAADYPHSEGTFPRSRAVASRLVDGLDPADADAILRGNAARLYGLDLAALARRATAG